jgi:hypothetical protein
MIVKDGRCRGRCYGGRVELLSIASFTRLVEKYESSVHGSLVRVYSHPQRGVKYRRQRAKVNGRQVGISSRRPPPLEQSQYDFKHQRRTTKDRLNESRKIPR